MKFTSTAYRNIFFSSLSLLLCVACWFAFSAYSEKEGTEQEKREGYQRYFNTHYKIFSLPMPQNLSFSGESVPMEKIDVQERLDRELLVNAYWQSQTLLFHKRANRWFPVIEPILAEEGVPDDFKYLALIESGLTNVVSPAGATGYWQIRKETGKELGLEINDEVDERYHVEKATRAACKYLKQAHAKFGNWTMAAASYNIGIYGITRQIERQKVNDYYDLLLVEETSRYLFRILAAKEIITKPAQYGFHFRPADLYEPYTVIEVNVNGGVKDLAVYALEKGINYKILKTLNPWLRENYLTNPYGKEYAFKLPADSAFGIYIDTSIESGELDTLSREIIH